MVNYLKILSENVHLQFSHRYLQPMFSCKINLWFHPSKSFTDVDLQKQFEEKTKTTIETDMDIHPMDHIFSPTPLRSQNLEDQSPVSWISFSIAQGLTSRIVIDVNTAFTLSSKQELHFFNRSLQDRSEDQRDCHSVPPFVGRKLSLKFGWVFVTEKFIFWDFFVEHSAP